MNPIGPNEYVSRREVLPRISHMYPVGNHEARHSSDWLTGAEDR